MFLDAVLATAVTALVCVLPGFFWARCLAAPAGRGERLIWSAGLSMALVPAVALWLAHLSGGGVTLPIAVVAPLLVLGTGLAAYLFFGPDKNGTGTPLARVPVPPGVLPLGLVAAAFALALGTNLWNWDRLWLARACQGWRSDLCLTAGGAHGFLLPIALLVLAAGVAYYLGSRPEPVAEGRTGGREASDAGSGGSLLRRALLPAVLVLVLVRGYLGVVLHDWPFIRGLDHYSHAVMTNRVMGEGQIEPYFVYPPGFHALTAVVTRISGLDPLEVFPVLGPALLLLPALSCYVLARRLWGYEYGVAAAFFAGVVTGGSYYFFNDAMYPNLTGAQFILVLAVAALMGLYRAPTARGGLLLALVGSSIVLYHQVSSLYLALLLLVVTVLFVPYLLLRDRRRGMALVLSFGLLGALAVPYAYETYDLLGMAGSALGLGTGDDTATLVGTVVGTQFPYEAGLFVGLVVSQPVAWLGLLGALFVAAELARRRADGPQTLALLTLLLWAGLLFAGSRTSMSGFPQRFARDLGVPLSVLAGLALVVLAGALLRRGVAGRVPPRAGALALVLVGCVTGLRVVQGYDQAVRPSPQLKTTPEISAAGEWLSENNTGGNIMVSPHANQVPSRMMLAMGDYSEFQSFTRTQIDNPRDLPPTGPGPLEDVLHVVENPAGERTPGLLEKHDVRYVVLFKDMPDREVVDYWRGFKEHPDLYRPVFENGDVLLVEPRTSPDRTADTTTWGAATFGSRGDG